MLNLGNLRLHLIPLKNLEVIFKLFFYFYTKNVVYFWLQKKAKDFCKSTIQIAYKLKIKK